MMAPDFPNSPDQTFVAKDRCSFPDAVLTPFVDDQSVEPVAATDGNNFGSDVWARQVFREPEQLSQPLVLFNQLLNAPQFGLELGEFRSHLAQFPVRLVGLQKQFGE
jgi:hypothetical protein